MRLLPSPAIAVVLAAGFALMLAGPASAQDAPGHCPSITKAQAKKITAPYKRKYRRAIARGAMLWYDRTYSVWSEEGKFQVLYWPRPGYSKLRVLKSLPMKNLCPLEGDPQMPGPSWWPPGVPFPGYP